MSAKQKGSKRSSTGDREQAAPGGKGDLTGAHATTALIPLMLRNARDLIAFLDIEGRRIYNSPSYGPLLGDTEKLVGSDSFDDVHPEDRERVRRIFRDTVRTGIGSRTEYRLLARDGRARVVQSEGSAIRDEEDRVTGVVVVGRDITEERDADAKLAAALRRQKVLAEFSLFALREANPLRVIERAATLVAEALEVDFGTVVELEADGKALRVAAGHNWPQHRLGTHISAGADTQAGHALELYRLNGAETLEAPQPVAIEDLRTDGRFVNTFRVRELGVVSSVCVVVPTAEGPYGVLAAHSRARRRFEPVESEFMQAVANVLSAALANFRMQAAQRESEARFRSLAELSSDWFWENDADGRLTWISESVERVTGTPVQWFLGKRPQDLTMESEDSSGEAWRLRQQARERREPYRDFRYRLRHPGGELWISNSGVPRFDASGTFLGYRGATTDITERKRAEQALAESEARFRSLTALSSDWYWEQDKELRWTFFSPGFSQRSGATPEKLLGKQRWEEPGRVPLQGTWEEHRATLEAHKPFRNREFLRVNKDGTRSFQSINGEPFYDKAGNFAGYRGTSRDITGRKRAEEALRAQTERLRVGQATARLIVMDWDIPNDRLEWGDSPEWLRGPLPPSGRYPLYKDQIHPEDLDKFLRMRASTIESLQDNSLEYRIVRTDGEVLWVESRHKVLTDTAGKATRMLVAIHDITEHKRAEQELLARKEGDRALIELGLLGLREQDPRALLESAVQVIARTLEVELAAALELLPDRSGLRVVAGTGWKPGAVGHVIVGADIDSQAGYTIRQYELARGRSGEHFAPVVVADLASETRFRAPPSLLEYGVVSGVTVVIPGAEHPWGVLGVHSRTRRRFEPREAEFLQAAANVLSAALERCRTHAALLESEARFRSLTHLSSDWYWEQDEQFRLTLVSDDMQAETGLDTQAYLGKRRWEISTPNLTEQDWLHHRAQLERHEPFRDFVMRRADPNGREVWLSVSGDPVFDEAGDFKGYRGVGSDITKKKLAETALRESESRFRSLTELSSDWYWEQDEQFRFTTLSGPGAAAMSGGGDPSVYLGKARWEISDLEHVEGDWSRHRAQLERHEPFRDLILRRRMNDGTLRYMSVSGEPVVDEAGGFKGYRGVASDVTDTVVLERSLRESEQRFLSFMDNVPANAFIKDSQLRYTWINRAHELHRHGGLHDVLGCDDFQLRPLAVARALREQDEEVLRAKGPAWFVNRIPIMDGREAHFLVVKFPLPDASGAPGVAGIGIDISEQYRLAQTVRQLLRRLVHAQEAERRKVAGDLHDLIGQKLTALSLGLDIVRQVIPGAARGPLNPRLQQMSALLEETIAAVRNMMSELRPPVLDDHGLLPALHWYASQFEARTAFRVRVTGPEHGPRLDRDIEIALFRIAQEALTNAAKHSGGSRVRIEVERSAESVRMCIEDDGRGFDERALERAAKPTSWGMSAMRERAHAFGGQLRVESRAPGAAIVVDVPLEHAD